MIFGLHLDEAARAFGFLADLQTFEIDGVFKDQFRSAKTAGVLILDERLMFFFVTGKILPLLHDASRFLLAFSSSAPGRAAKGFWSISRSRSRRFRGAFPPDQRAVGT